MGVDQRSVPNKMPSLVNFSVLVVDDDSTSLSIVSGMLRTWKYQVATVKNSVDALSALRVQHHVDLVVTDLHMPGMNGIQLQKQIDEEFNLPVVIMSSDENESNMLESLNCGAVYFLVKPLNVDDLRNIWQYAVAFKRCKSIVIEETGSTIQIRGSSSTARICDVQLHEELNSISSVNETKKNKTVTRKDCKRKTPPKKSNEEQEEDRPSAPKKAKVVWTNSLHTRFLHAIHCISLEKAVPKKILELMNVPGLTRENVASHLQKYRIFLKRVAEKGDVSPKKLSHRALRSNFATGHALLKDPHKVSTRTPFQPLKGSVISALGANRPFLNPQTSAGKSVLADHFVFGQFGNKSSSAANPANFGFEPNQIINGANLPSSGLMNGTMPIYQQEARVADQVFGVANFGLSSNGFHGSNCNSSNNIDPGNFTHTNYAGIRINSDGEIMGLGRMQKANPNNVCSGFMNKGIMMKNMDANNKASNGCFSYLGQDGSSSSSAPAHQGVNQVTQPAAGFNTNFMSHAQENASTLLPQGMPLPQQQFAALNYRHAQENDFSFDYHALDNMDNTLKQYGEDGKIFNFQTNNYQSNYQEQTGGVSVLNTDLSSNTLFNVEDLNPLMNQLMIPDTHFPILESSALNHNSHVINQAQEISSINKEVININANGIGEYTPTFDFEIPNKQQSDGDFINFEEFNALNIEIENGSFEDLSTTFNQVWNSTDDFVDCSMLRLDSAGPLF